MASRDTPCLSRSPLALSLPAQKPLTQFLCLDTTEKLGWTHLQGGSSSASTPLRNWAGLIFGAGHPLHWRAFTSTPGLPWGLSSKESARNAGDTGDKGSIPGSGRSAAGGYGNAFRYSCLENPMGRGAWRATVHGVAKSRTRLKRLSMCSCWSLLNRCQ